MQKISERLRAIAGYVTPGDLVADIGTDHAYLPIRLMQQGIISHAILTDLNEGPLQRARENAKNAEIAEGSFEFRQGDGLSPLRSGEAQTIVIAGMGGELIAKILADSQNTAKSAEKLILQPRTRSDSLRHWLSAHEFTVTDEDLAAENGKICEILIVSAGDQTASNGFDPLSCPQFEVLLEKKHKLLRRFLEEECRRESSIRRSAARSTGQAAQRNAAEAEKRLEQCHRYLERIENL